MCVQIPRGMTPPVFDEPPPRRYERSWGLPLTLQTPIHQAATKLLPAMLRQSSPVVLFETETQASNVKAPVGLRVALAGTSIQPSEGSPVRMSQPPNGCACAAGETSTARVSPSRSSPMKRPDFMPSSFDFRR